MKSINNQPDTANQIADDTLAEVTSERLDKICFADSAVDASTRVLKEILTYPPTRGQMEVTPLQFTRDEVTIVARLSGDVTGELFLGMAHRTATNIAREMLGTEIESLGGLAVSALSELGGMIVNGTAELLESQGAMCYGAWACVLMGKDERVTPFAVPTLAVPLRLLLGQVTLHVALEAHAPYTWASPRARLEPGIEQAEVTTLPLAA